MLHKLSSLSRHGIRRGSPFALALALTAGAGQALAADPPPPIPGAGTPPAASPPRAPDAIPHDAIDPSETRPATTPNAAPVPLLPSAPPPDATPATAPATAPMVAPPMDATPERTKTDATQPAQGNTARGVPVGDRAMSGEKRWEVGASLEFHHLFRQNDLAGAGVNKNLVYLGFLGRYQLTTNDRLTLDGGVYRHTYGDPGETGYRFDDIYVSYSHRFPLPGEVNLRLSAGAYLPTSFAAQKQSMILMPRAGVSADRTFGDLTVEARVRGTYYWMKYASAAGGAANPEAALSLSLALGYTMPFHRALSVGASLNTAYTGYYDVSNVSNPNSQFFGAIERPHQPVQQSYGWELFVRYAIPEFKKIRSDFTVSAAQGDPVVGYTSALHDGARHVYLLSRQVAEMFFTFEARY